MIAQHLEQKSLELLVAAIDFVDEQHRRAIGPRDRAQQRTLEQECLTENLRLALTRARGTPARLLQLDVQELLRVVPLVERGGHVEPLVALEANELRVERTREDFRDFGLADAGMSFDEQRLVQRHRQVRGRRRLAIGDVRLALHGVVEPGDLLPHARLSRAKSRGAFAKRALQCGQQK